MEAAMKAETLETRLLNRIDRKRGDVFLRADFGDLGGYDQVGRVLRELVRKGRLVRVGQGLYARAAVDDKR
jgi:Transcriptional regulator, AbiEi antitoxin